MRATIKMIAERAGVSIGTVDRVLHDRPYVKEEVRRRVLEVMEELDYQPNRVASALATSGMARHFAIIQPTWESYVGEAMAAGVAKFRQDRQDYNVSVTIHPYRQGRMEDCLHLLDTLAEEVQGIALCAADCPQVRQKLELLAGAADAVVTFNSDIAGAGGCATWGRTPTTPAGWPGTSPPSSSGPETGSCWCTPTTATPDTRAGQTAFWSGLRSGGSGRRTAGWQRPTTTMMRHWQR